MSIFSTPLRPTYHYSGWRYIPLLGFMHENNEDLFAYGRWRDNYDILSEYELRFWDWSQYGEDCCYGQGKWMPVKDQNLLDSFPNEWKKEIKERIINANKPFKSS